MKEFDKEQESIRKWAAKESGWLCFSSKNDDVDSYYSKKENSEYLIRYDFQGVPELKIKFDDMWNGTDKEQIMDSVLATSMKHKIHVGSARTKDNMVADDGDLKDYIYNF